MKQNVGIFAKEQELFLNESMNLVLLKSFVEAISLQLCESARG